MDSQVGEADALVGFEAGEGCGDEVVEVLAGGALLGLELAVEPGPVAVEARRHVAEEVVPGRLGVMASILAQPTRLDGAGAAGRHGAIQVEVAANAAQAL